MWLGNFGIVPESSWNFWERQNPNDNNTLKSSDLFRWTPRKFPSFLGNLGELASTK
jgi:hypothetical protein